MNNNSLILSSLISAALVVLAQSAHCPNPDTIKPCVCGTEKLLRVQTKIQCGGTEDINLKKIFQNLSQELNGTDRKYDSLVLNNTRITELPANVFSGVQFWYIEIRNAHNLKQVHQDAFNGTHNCTGTFASYNVPFDTPTQTHSIFRAINSVKSLEVIEIWNSSLTAIPDQAFGALNLALVYLVEGQLERLGARMFDKSTNLMRLYLFNNRISSIAENAFTAESVGKDILRIDLRNNTINENTLSKGLINGINHENTMIVLDNNKVKYLNESTFSPFFEKNFMNAVNLNTIDCNDCRNAWLTKATAVQRSYSQLTCTTGEKIDAKTNFKNC